MTEPVVLAQAVSAADLHSDETGTWIVIDDPASDDVLMVPVAWDHRRVIPRAEAALRLPEADVVPVELDAMRRCHDAMEPLTMAARDRAMAWLGQKLIGSGPARERRDMIQEMWLAGASLDDIASELRTSRRTVTVTMTKMRQQGWNLPYRRTPR